MRSTDNPENTPDNKQALCDKANNLLNQYAADMTARSNLVKNFSIFYTQKKASPLPFKQQTRQPLSEAQTETARAQLEARLAELERDMERLLKEIQACDEKLGQKHDPNRPDFMQMRVPVTQ